MTDADQKLVQAITQQVLRAMEQRGGQASIKPPIGVCTGDYSQFADRPDLVASENKSTNPTQNTNEDSTPILTGIITANQLQNAITASSSGVVRLAADARPTPMANDWVREHPDQVQRVARLTERQTVVGSDQAEPWMVWVAGQCPAVDAVTAKLANWLQRSAAPRTDAGLAQAVSDLSQGVKNNRLAGGLLFVETAALAGCYANRCAPLRAVVGTHAQTVSEAVDKLAANVLIIEYPRTQAEPMAEMVGAFLSGRGHVVSPALQRTLAELGRTSF